MADIKEVIDMMVADGRPEEEIIALIDRYNKDNKPGKTTDPASSGMDSGSDDGSSEQSEISVAKDINISPAGLFFNVLQETQPGVGKALAVLSDLGAGLFRTADEIGEFAETMVEIEAGKIGGIPGSGLAPYIAKRIAARQSGVTLEEFDETNPYNIIKLEGIANIFDKATIKYKDPETGQQEDFMSLFSKGEYGKSVESFVYETAGALPSLMVSRIPGGYAMLGGGAFANKLNTDLFKRPDQTAEKILSNALIYGGSDAIGEYIGGRYLNKLAGVVKGGGKAGLDRAKDVMIGGIGAFIKTAFKGGSSEFMQEAITSVIQSKSDEEIYGDEISTAQHFRQALHAGLIGFALGSGSGGVSLGMNKKNKTKFYEYLAPKSYKNDRLKLKQKELDAQKDLDNAPASKKEKFQKRLDNIKKKGEDLQNQLYDWFETTSKNDPKQIELMIEKIQEKHDALDIITGGDTYSNDAKEEAKRDFKDADGVISDLFSVTDINYDSEVELELDKYIRAAEEIDEANKSLWFKSKDLKYEYVNSQEKFDELKKQYGNKIANEADGFFDITEDGKKKIFINRDVAASESSTNVIGHELLHYALSNRFANDPKYLRDSVIAFRDYIKKLDNGDYILKSIESRLANPKNGYAKLNENGKVQRDKDGLIVMQDDSWIEEYFTMFSDLIKSEKIDVVEDASKGLANTLRTTVRGLGLGFNNVDFKNGQEVFDFLIDYNKNIGRTGLLGAITQRKAIKQAAGKDVKKADVGTKKSMTASQKAKVIEKVDKLGQVDTDGNNLTEKGTGNFYYQAEADNVVKEIKEKGYLDNLIAAKYKADKVPKNFVSDVITALTPDIKAFKPEENNSLFGYLQGRITFRAGDVYNKIYKQKEENKGSRDVGETTKEGDVKIQVAAEKSSEMEAFEEEDLSIRGQAKKAKADKQQYSEYRRKLGFETGSKIYNEVLDNVKKSLMMAYGTTQNITDAQLRAKAIATKLKKEYANLNSPLFKQIKNFLTYGVADVYVKKGTKDTYISNLKKFREDIVKNTSTADLVQMERNTPEADRIFTTFVKTLTSVEQVQDAVNREQLPPDALNKITKDKKTGKGAFSPSLYNKIMPTETELVSWADQPRINPVTGLRQGLKGTRKDGLAMRMVNGLVTDAIMEARQSEEVQNKISEMGIDPGSVAELGAAIGREVNVKFSKSNATGDISAAIDGAGDVNVYSQIKFSKSHREAYEKQLNKRRPDLTEDQRKNAVQSVFDFVDGKEIPNNKKSKYEKMAMHYTANGFLILPEDGYKVVEAEKIATQKKLDPFSFKNPNVLIETYVGEVKGTRTNPDNVKTFTNKTELTNGVTVYNVEDSKQGQLDTRKVIDTHFGKKANPWCLCARLRYDFNDGDVVRTVNYDGIEDIIMNTYLNEEYDFGSLEVIVENTAESKVRKLVDKLLVDKKNDLKHRVEEANKVFPGFTKGDGKVVIFIDRKNVEYNLNNAFKLWKNYNKEGNGHQIAFQNGKLVSFRDGNEMKWWDRNDKPSNAVVVRGKKGKDGFKPVIEVGKNKETILAYEKVTGDKKNGTTIRKDIDGDVVFQETKKNGKLNGKRITVKKAGTIDAGSNDYSSMQTENYKDGSRLDFKEERTYTNKKATVKTSFGRDEITLNNITKYERSFQDSKDNIRLPDNEVTTIEGTVKQKYFKEFNDPSSITDGFVKTNLPNLTPAHERYYSMQGEKVEVVTNFEIADKKLEDIQTGNTTTVTINGVEQETRVKFSKSSVNYDLKNTSIKFSKNNKQIRKAIINAGNEIIKLKETNPESSSIDIYNVVQENLNKVDENFTYEEAVGVIELHTKNKYGENASLDVKQLLSKGIDNLIDGLAEVNLDVLREESLPLIASGFNKILNSGFDTAAQEKVLLGLVGYIGRSIRNITVKEGSVTRRGIINTNDKLFKWMDDNLAAIPPALKKALKVIKGKAYGKENVSKILYKNQDIKKFEHVDSIKAALTSTKKTVDKQSVLNTVDGEAITAVRFLEYILGPKSPLNAAEKLAFVELSFIDMMGLMRKTYPAGFYLFGKDHDKSNTKLEHNPPVAEVKEIWAQYAQGKINIDNVLDWYVNNNAKVNVVSNKMADTLSKQGLNTFRKNNQDRYENPVVKAQLKKDAGRGNKNLGNNNINTPHLFKNRDKFQGAIKFSRSANNPTKGITVLDFDDTLATSKSLIIFTRPDGTKGTLNAEQYASTYESLSDLGYKFDFSEFTKVVDGKTAPLFNKAMKLQGKFGPENMFVLTARPAESAAAIHAFLKANGLNIPLKNITGLANSTAEAKALWMAEKVGEGYNDFYFADDALQNVKAVDNMLSQFDVKRKVQQAVPSIIKQKVKFSKSSLKNTINSPQYKKFRNNIKDRVLYHGGSETINTIRDNNAVWFYLDDIEAAQMWGDGEVYSVKMKDLQGMVVLPDLNDVDMFTEHIQEKFNLKDNAYDIRDILKHPKADDILTEWVDWSSKNDMTYDIGYNLYEKGNVTNGAAVTVLGVIPKNKIQQVSPKFSKSSLRGNKAVKNMLDQLDVKSKVQQARVKFSKSMNDQFNDILENVTGIESIKRFSIIKGRKRGESKGKFRYFVPPSHEDFVGLLYNFMGKGKEGNKHRDFLEQALVRPLNRANRELDTARQSVANDYKELNKQFEDVKSKFTKKTPDGDFTFQDAIRVYLWDKHGYKIPGLSETDQTKLAELVMSDPQLQAYAETLNVISKQETYVNPTDGWNGGDIRMDLDDATGRIGREQYFSEFIENTSIIFSEENLNKIEAGYGKEVRESLEDMLYRIKTGRNRPTGQNAQVNKLMNYLNGSVGTVMFFNMRSALLQQMSIVNYINFADNNIFAAAKAFANQKQYWADWSFIFNSDMLKQRRGGIQTDVNGAELAASLRNSKDITRKLISKLLELGFLPTQIGDNIAIATGGATYYRNRINTYLKQGLSKKEAEAKAFTDFQDITQSTQQSARPDMVSKQQASVIGKVILNFQNVTSQFNRLGKKAFQDIYNRRITKPNTTQMQSDISNAARITYYFAVQNAIFYTLQTALFAMMFDDDEEDNNNLFLKKRERLINGSVDSVLRGTGLIGGVVATLKNVAIAFARQRDVKYNPDESAVALEALNLSPVLGIKFRKIVNAEKTLNYNKKVIDEMETFDIDNPQWSAVTNYTEAFTNIPLNRLYNKTQNVRQALNNEHAAWERTLMFLGWSQYNLNLENKKMEEIKEKVKSKKKKKSKGFKDFKFK